MPISTILNMRTEFEDITENYNMNGHAGSSINSLNWFVENGHKSNSLRNGFDDAMENQSVDRSHQQSKRNVCVVLVALSLLEQVLHERKRNTKAFDCGRRDCANTNVGQVHMLSQVHFYQAGHEPFLLHPLGVAPSLHQRHEPILPPQVNSFPGCPC